MLKVRQNN